MKPLVSVAITALVLLTAGTTFAQDGITEVQILAKQYDTALLQHDMDFLHNIFDDDGTFIDDTGRVLSKKEVLAELASTKFQFAQSVDREFRAVGGAVVETGIWEAAGTTDGKKFKRQGRYADVWVNKKGKWFITLEQLTPIAEGNKVTSPALKKGYPEIKKKVATDDSKGLK